MMLFGWAEGEARSTQSNFAIKRPNPLKSPSDKYKEKVEVKRVLCEQARATFPSPEPTVLLQVLNVRFQRLDYLWGFNIN